MSDALAIACAVCGSSNVLDDSTMCPCHQAIQDRLDDEHTIELRPLRNTAAPWQIDAMVPYVVSSRAFRG